MYVHFQDAASVSWGSSISSTIKKYMMILKDSFAIMMNAVNPSLDNLDWTSTFALHIPIYSNSFATSQIAIDLLQKKVICKSTWEVIQVKGLLSAGIVWWNSLRLEIEKITKEDILITSNIFKTLFSIDPTHVCTAKSRTIANTNLGNTSRKNIKAKQMKLNRNSKLTTTRDQWK